MKFLKEHIFDEITQTYINIDERSFEDCVKKQLEEIRKQSQTLILASAPDYKQRNAALGLLSEQETQQIKDNIQNIRNISNSLEQQILAVIWDQTEETRSASCDAVQAIRWL